MMESVEKRVAAVSDVPLKILLAAGSLGSFAWLLGHDQIHPLVVYCLQFYLAF